jgi:hypothetical protein
MMDESNEDVIPMSIARAVPKYLETPNKFDKETL